MIEIDGSQKSGSGTIVRFACGLAALLGEELHLTNIRAKRDKPGLRPQHLKAIQAVQQVCNGALEGGSVGSREIRFKPGSEIRGGSYRWDIGTAGSTTMLAMTLLPVACFARKPLSFEVSGGLFQDFAPSAYHMQHVLFPQLARMGVDVRLSIARPGYVPRGGGITRVEVTPVAGMKPVGLAERGEIASIEGVALSSHLKDRQVSERMAEECLKVLRSRGYHARIDTVYDSTALQKGAALAIWATTGTGCILGADRAGEPRRSSEEIGRYAARSLMEDLESGATVDRHLADQLVLYATLAHGVSRYRIPHMTEHVETNLWLAETVLGCEVNVDEGMVQIEGVGLTRGP